MARVRWWEGKLVARGILALGKTKSPYINLLDLTPYKRQNPLA